MEKKYDVLTSGYVSMDRMLKIDSPARVGYTSLVTNRSNTQINYGGCGTNIACNMSRLGMSAMPVIRVGDDWEEIGFKQFLLDNRIPLDALEQVEGELTSVCYLVQDPEGQHITLFYPGAMDGRYCKPLRDEWFQQARIGVVTVGSRPDNEEFLLRCKRNGLPMAFSMKGDMKAFERDFLLELLDYCSIIFTNETERREIESLYGRPITDWLSRGNARCVVTTMGGDGSACYALEGGKLRETFVPICPFNAGVVDTTGSGDAFVSGFLYGYLNGRDIRECAMMGTVLASFVIEKVGCCTGAPERAAFEERLERFRASLK